MSIRVKEAAEILDLAAPTVRKWCNDGKIPFTLNVAGQRVFDREELEKFKNKMLGIEKEEETYTIFYARSSSGNDITIKTQTDKLKEHYGEANKIFTDKSSGLNENRKGLKSLIKEIKENKDKNITVYITNKDRLSRFGFSYLEELFAAYNTKIIILDSDETKEPQEVLMQDFMSLLASFSGKFYRIRGWEQKKKFLKDINDEVDKHGKK